MPDPLSTSARAELVTMLEATGRTVYGVAPKVPIPPCLVVVPDAPWIIPNRLGSARNYELRYRVLVVTDPRDNEAAMKDAEAAVDAILDTVASKFAVTQVGPPQLTDIGSQGAVQTTEITLTAQIKE